MDGGRARRAHQGHARRHLDGEALSAAHDFTEIPRDILVARDLRVVIDGRTVLDGVNLTVRTGEFVGLIGVNGAGKTTLLRVLLRALRPTSGTITQTDRRRVGYLPQKVTLDSDTPLRARDVVALGIDGGRLGLPLRNRTFHQRVDRILASVGATAFAEQRIGELSGGQQQRALLAHALVGEPRLLLLDEPLANLDPASAQDVVQLLDRLRRETGVAIVMTAHDMNLLLPVMDRIVYLAEGCAATGTPDEVVRTEVLSSLYGRAIQVVRAAGRVLVVADELPGADAHHTGPVPQQEPTR